MTVEVTEIYLLDVASGEPVAAELWHVITEEQLADWEGEWVPELFRAMQRLRRAGVERAHWPQSRHWNWRRKVAVLQGMLANPGFGIVCAGLTQGMMIVDTVREGSTVSKGSISSTWSLSRTRRGTVPSCSILRAIAVSAAS